MRWGFIGASNIAERVIPSLRKIAGQELVAVCSRSAPRAQQFAEQQGLASAHTDLSELLALGLDAVYISSTNEQHAAQTLAALDAGCHVLCEKPLAMSLADAAQMIDRAQAVNRVLARHHPRQMPDQLHGVRVHPHHLVAHPVERRPVVARPVTAPPRKLPHRHGPALPLHLGEPSVEHTTRQPTGRRLRQDEQRGAVRRERTPAQREEGEEGEEASHGAIIKVPTLTVPAVAVIPRNGCGY